MAHWRTALEKEYLGAWDLDGRDVDVTILEAFGGELTGEGGKKSKKPVARLKGFEKKLALNATNCKAIEKIAGTPDMSEWSGLRVTIYPTTTTFGGEVKDCIRVRPNAPRAAPQPTKRGGGALEAIAGCDTIEALEALVPKIKGIADATKQAEVWKAYEAREKQLRAKKLYRQPGDTMEFDENERRWLAEAGRPVSEGSTMGPDSDEEVEIINAAARKEGLIDA